MGRGRLVGTLRSGKGTLSYEVAGRRVVAHDEGPSGEIRAEGTVLGAIGDAASHRPRPVPYNLQTKQLNQNAAEREDEDEGEWT